MIWVASSEPAGGVAAMQAAQRKRLIKRSFPFRISDALEMKLEKRAKALFAESGEVPHSALRTHASFPLFRRQWVHLVQDADGFQNYAARDFQTLRAELVHRVLGCVPEHIVIAIHKIDDVGGRHSALHKWDVIIA